MLIAVGTPSSVTRSNSMVVHGFAQAIGIQPRNGDATGRSPVASLEDQKRLRRIDAGNVDDLNAIGGVGRRSGLNLLCHGGERGPGSEQQGCKAEDAKSAGRRRSAPCDGPFSSWCLSGVFRAPL